MAATQYPKNSGVNVVNTGAKLVKKGEANTDISAYQDILQSYMGGIDQGVAENIAGSAKKTELNSAVNDPYIKEIERRAEEERQRQLAAAKAAAAAKAQQDKAESYQRYQANKGKFQKEAFGEAEAYDYGDINRERERIQQSNYLENPSNFLLTEQPSGVKPTGKPGLSSIVHSANKMVALDDYDSAYQRAKEKVEQREYYADPSNFLLREDDLAKAVPATSAITAKETPTKEAAKAAFETSMDSQNKAYAAMKDAEIRLEMAKAQKSSSLGNDLQYRKLINEYNEKSSSYQTAVAEHGAQTAAYVAAVTAKETANYLTEEHGRELLDKVNRLSAQYYGSRGDTSKLDAALQEYRKWQIDYARFSEEKDAAGVYTAYNTNAIQGRIDSLQRECDALDESMSEMLKSANKEWLSGGKPDDAQYRAAENELFEKRSQIKVLEAMKADSLAYNAAQTRSANVKQTYLELPKLEADAKAKKNRLDMLTLQWEGITERGGDTSNIGKAHRQAMEEYVAAQEAWEKAKALTFSYEMNVTLNSLPDEDRRDLNYVSKYLEGTEVLLPDKKNYEEAKQRLIDKYGYEKYKELEDYGVRDYNAFLRRESQRDTQELTKSVGGKIGASALSVVTNVLSAPGALFEVVKQSMFNPSYAPYDTNAAGFRFQNLTQDIRGAVSEGMDEGGALIYSTVMSGIDSLVAAQLFGGAGGLALGVTAATNAMEDIALRGGTKEQVIIGGAMAGVFECLFESLSIEQLRSMKQNVPDSLDAVIRNYGKSILTNFSEEANTELANIIFDSITMGAVSNAAVRMQELIDRGYSESQAKKLLASELASQILIAGGSGALMGAGFAALYNTIPAINLTIADAATVRNYVNFYNTSLLLPEADRPSLNANTLTADNVIKYGADVYDALKEYAKNADADPQVRAAMLDLAAVNAVTTITATEKAAAMQEGQEAAAQTAEARQAEAADLAPAQEEGRQAAQEDLSRITEREETKERTQETTQETTQGAQSESEAAEYTNTVAEEINAPAAAETAAETERTVPAAAERREQRSEYWTRVAADLISQIDNQYNTEAERREVIENEIREIEAGGEVQLARAMRAIANESDSGYNQAKGEINNVQEKETGAGDLRSDGSGERNVGRRASEQAGPVAEGTGRNQSREAGNRQRIRAQRLSAVPERSGSTREIIGTGSTADKIYVHNPDTSDTELNEITETAKRNGYQVTFVKGDMHFQREDGSTFSAKGVRTEDGHIFVNVTHGKYSATEIFEHELFHNLVEDNPGLLEAAKQHLLEHYTEEQINKLLDKYKAAYAGTGITEEGLYVEILGDIYANIMKSPIREAVRKEAAERSGVREGRNEGAKYSVDEEDRPISQAINSAKTSIKQIPALFKNKNVKFGKTNIDIGGGRFDLATDYLAEQGTKNYVFDPYNRSEEVNKATLDFLRGGNRADTATCANVLNVIAEPKARANVILETAKAIDENGKAYFMVYEGDGSGVGKETASGWQNNRKTESYVSEIEKYFKTVERKGKLITASDPKADLPKAAWEISPGNAIRYSIDDERIKALEKEIAELEIDADNEAVWGKLQALRLQLAAIKEQKGPEYRPHTTMQQTGTRLINLFKIPAGQKAKTRSQINEVLSRLSTQGYVANSDVESLLRVMYERGEVLSAVDQVYSDIRDFLSGTKLYVSPEVKAEFGDNWGAFRRSLFAAGISATNNKSDIGIDQKYMELAEMYPGLFSSEETDMSNMLRELRSAADMGKAQTLTLAEAAANEGISSEEEFDALYKIAQNELQLFADKADLEVKYREEKDEVKKEAQRKAYDRYLERRKNDIDSRERSELNRKTLNLIKRIKPLARYNAETYEAAVNDQSEHVQKLIRNAVQNIDTVATKLTGKKRSALENIQEAYKESLKDPNFIPSTRTKAAIERLQQIQVDNMTIDDIQALYEALTTVEHAIQNYKKTVGEMEERYFDDLAMSAKDEFKQGRGLKSSNVARRFLDEDQLSPERALLRYVGYDRNTTWASMVEALVQGDIDAAEYELGARLIFQDFIKKNQKWLKTAAGKNADLIEIEIPSDWAWDKSDEEIRGGSVKVKVTQMMLVQMALDMTNIDNRRHVIKGGYTFLDMDLYKKGKTADAIAKGRNILMEPVAVNSIVEKYLKPEGKEYVKLLQKYYDEYSKPRINDRSQKLEGIDRAITDHYAPIRTNQNFNSTDTFAFDLAISHTGSLKERIRGTVPVLLLDADETVAWHRSNMAKYYGYAIPVRNMDMLMQHKIGGEKAVSAELANLMGASAVDYVNSILVEIQNGDRTNKFKNGAEETLRRITGNYIRNVLTANLSSAMKQLSAFGLASAEIGPQYIAAGLLPGKKTSRELINKYTPFLEYRNDYEWLGDVSDFVRNVKGAQTPAVMKYLLGLNWLQKVDIWVNRRLWDAAEKYVKRTTGLTPGTKSEIESGNDPFYKAVAKEFNRVTQLSQTNTNFMSKPKILQAEGLLGQSFTMFRTDAMQAAGIIRENLGNMVTQYKKGNKQLAARATKKAVQSVIGVLSAFMWEPIAKMIRDILVRKDDDYKEDDKLSFDKMFENEVKGVIYNIAGLTIFGEQLLDFVYSQIKGTTYYEPDIPSVSMIGDSLKKAWQAATDIGEWIASAGDEKLNKGDYWASNGDKIMKDLRNLAYTISQLLGIPAKNLETNIVGILGQAFPQLKAAYDDVFKEYKKSDIKSLEGEAKNVAINSYLTDALGKISPEVKELYAELYKKFGDGVLPGSIETLKIKDGEERNATTSEQVQYESLYRSTMIDALNALTESEYFNSLSREEQADVLKALNTYASDQAKKMLTERDDNWTDKLAEIIGKDLSVDMGVIYYALQKTIKNDNADDIASLAKLDALFAGETFDGEENTVKNSAKRKRLELLDEMPISDTAKGLLYQAFMDKNEGMEALAKELTGAEFYKAAKAVEGDYTKSERLERLAASDLSSEAIGQTLEYAFKDSKEKDAIVELITSGILTGKEAANMLAATDGLKDGEQRNMIAQSDLPVDKKWDAMSKYIGGAADAQASFDAIKASGATPEQYATLKNEEMESKYLSLIDSDISADTAVKILTAVKDMPDLPEGESYKVSEKQRAAVDACANGTEQVAAFMAFAGGDAATKAKTSAKLTSALDYDVDVKMYLDFKDTVLRDYNFESPDKEGISQKEAKAALDASNYTKQQKAVLYQLISMTWTANKNPYDKAAAAAIHAAYDGAK